MSAALNVGFCPLTSVCIWQRKCKYNLGVCTYIYVHQPLKFSLLRAVDDNSSVNIDMT